MFVQNDKEANLLKLSEVGSHRLCHLYKTLDVINNRKYFSKVYKDFDKPFASQEVFINERLAVLDHKNIVKYYGSVHQFNGNVCLNFELSEQGNLFDNYRRIIDSSNKNYKEYDKIYSIRKILTPLIDALIEIHKQGIIHNDLKMENILLFNDGKSLIPKIGDFNNSILFNAKKDKIKNVSHVKMIVSSVPFYFEKPSFKFDYWCLGIIIYQMLINKNPFDYENCADFIESVHNQSYRNNEDYKRNEHLILKDLIDKLLVSDSNQRLDDSNILTHPFFNTGSNRCVMLFSGRRRQILNTKKSEILCKYNLSKRTISILKRKIKKVKIYAVKKYVSKVNNNKIKRKLRSKPIHALGI